MIEVSWDRETLCGLIMVNGFFLGLALTHWGLPCALQMHHGDDGEVRGWQFMVLCFALGYQFQMQE